MKKSAKRVISGLCIGLMMFSSNVFATSVTKGTAVNDCMAYSEPDGEALCSIDKDEFFIIEDEIDDYYAVRLGGVQLAYVDKDSVELSIVKDEEEELEEEIEEVIEEEISSDKGEQVVDFAMNYVGLPYVSGGTSLQSGVDCSGFSQQVYKSFGVNLARTSRDQYASNGYAVSRSQLKAGDLVFYGYSSVSHVAIYIGNDKIIHAPVPGKSVCVAPIQQRGDAPIIGYKRVL